MTDMDINLSQSRPTEEMVTLTHVIYALHAFSALMGMLGPIFGRSLGGFPGLGVSPEALSRFAEFLHF